MHDAGGCAGRIRAVRCGCDPLKTPPSAAALVLNYGTLNYEGATPSPLFTNDAPLFVKHTTLTCTRTRRALGMHPLKKPATPSSACIRRRQSTTPLYWKHRRTAASHRPSSRRRTAAAVLAAVYARGAATVVRTEPAARGAAVRRRVACCTSKSSCAYNVATPRALHACVVVRHAERCTAHTHARAHTCADVHTLPAAWRCCSRVLTTCTRVPAPGTRAR
jgi:hypothetical protein